MSYSKKAFTLVEILISISLFSIIILFLYQTLDMTKKSNSFYSQKLDIKKDQNDIKKVIFLDLIHADKNSVKISLDNDENTIFQITTTNIYHNPFNKHVTYLVSKEQNLLRIESKIVFNKNKIDENFFNNSYIDILDKELKKFKVNKQINKKIVFYILKENQEKIVFSF
ncbi:MAG: prepilin-type N-terminal cleavage/methylation domain-containing protein [Campylobacterota bacterium]|nr:prepilin-type N-terminal cleavage/methylation domain-containing protein [Campylobacterota bacterium]